MNSCNFTGRLVRDPEIRYSTSEKPICVARFTLAVQRTFKNGEQTADFPRFVAFGRNAETIEKYCKQGIKLEISSSLRTGSYKNREGQTVYMTEFEVERFEFAESKKKEAETTHSTPATGASNTDPSGMSDEAFLNGLYDEYPFN